MAYFQSSVINKYLNAQDQVIIGNAYTIYVEYFHNPEIQENIRAAKEEQFQEGFLRELFVKVFGYKLNPQPNYNLTTELKNQKGAKKADGAILSEGKAIAVIELKGTNTTDLDKINTQAFNYKNNQANCVYVITSNFEKLRFFIHNAVEHIEFNLFTLTKKEFDLLWFCLNVDSLLSGLPEKAKNESIVAEENITKKLYKDYAAFKNDLWLNMVKNNQELDRLLLYKKTQNLLDRFLFILFAEDSGLLPPNLIAHIKQRWNILQDEDAYKPQYEIFKQYFGYINTGNKGKALQDNIFAYNGGLFRPDEILDNIKIDDEVLHLHLKKLSVYNFQSEVDVNILGHIFENSLHDIESVNAKLEGKEVDKRESRRKKDGIYYTPKYITKFIVANTIGKLCKKKKEEFGINEEEYAKGSKGRKKETIKNLHKCLKDYRDWLLKITICDPACGSGAFLNQALEFLIQEHTYIDELESKLFGSSIVFHYVSDHILENNLFGVDINDESIEIAKLSLWLQTAKNGRKLTSLSNNIKCGNSLIDDINVAGEKAFNWPNQFPDIFSKGGFDIVIGNPPWGAKLELKELDHIKDQHKDIIVRMIDSFMFFVDKSIELSKKDGYLGLIIPDVLFYQKDNEKLRKKLNSHTDIIHAINIGDGVFENVSRPSAILIASKDKHTDHFSLVGDFCKKQSFDISTIDYSKIKQSIFESLPFTIFPTRFITGYSILNRPRIQFRSATPDGGLV